MPAGFKKTKCRYPKPSNGKDTRFQPEKKLLGSQSPQGILTLVKYSPVDG